MQDTVLAKVVEADSDNIQHFPSSNNMADMHPSLHTFHMDNMDHINPYNPSHQLNNILEEEDMDHMAVDMAHTMDSEDMDNMEG